MWSEHPNEARVWDGPSATASRTSDVSAASSDTPSSRTAWSVRSPVRVSGLQYPWTNRRPRSTTLGHPRASYRDRGGRFGRGRARSPGDGPSTRRSSGRRYDQCLHLDSRQVDVDLVLDMPGQAVDQAEHALLVARGVVELRFDVAHGVDQAVQLRAGVLQGGKLSRLADGMGELHDASVGRSLCGLVVPVRSESLLRERDDGRWLPLGFHGGCGCVWTVGQRAHRSVGSPVGRIRGLTSLWRRAGSRVSSYLRTPERDEPLEPEFA